MAPILSEPLRFPVPADLRVPVLEVGGFPPSTIPDEGTPSEGAICPDCGAELTEFLPVGALPEASCDRTRGEAARHAKRAEMYNCRNRFIRIVQRLLAAFNRCLRLQNVRMTIGPYHLHCELWPRFLTLGITYKE
jgi:hypothetical protein